MKKLILSAVMMMAFVGTSMAKTGEVEVVSKLKSDFLLKLSNDHEIVKMLCAEQFLAVYNYYISVEHCSAELALEIARDHYDECAGNAGLC